MQRNRESEHSLIWLTHSLSNKSTTKPKTHWKKREVLANNSNIKNACVQCQKSECICCVNQFCGTVSVITMRPLWNLWIHITCMFCFYVGIDLVVLTVKEKGLTYIWERVLKGAFAYDKSFTVLKVSLSDFRMQLLTNHCMGFSLHQARAGTTVSDSSQTDSDTCNSPSVPHARPMLKNIPKFAISSDGDKPPSPKGSGCWPFMFALLPLSCQSSTFSFTPLFLAFFIPST